MSSAASGHQATNVRTLSIRNAPTKYSIRLKDFRWDKGAFPGNTAAFNKKAGLQLTLSPAADDSFQACIEIIKVELRR